MIKKIAIICTIFWMGLGAKAFSQGEINEPPQLNHEKRFYRADDGKLYVAQSIPIYLHISSSPDKGTDSHLMKSNTASEYTNPMYLSEGLNKFSNPVVYDPDTESKKSGASINFEIYCDATPPSTSSYMEKAPKFTSGGATYYGKGLSFRLESKDNLSGIFDTYISLNDNEYRPLDKIQLEFSSDGEYIIRFYSVDNVGIPEKAEKKEFTVDTTPPSTELSITGTHEWGIFSPDASIVLSSRDALSGVDNIKYRIDGGNEKVYNEDIKVSGLSVGKHTITYYSTDNVENKEKEQVYKFYFDKIPPKISMDVLGGKYEVESTIYVSDRSQIELTANDNKAGIDQIYYAIDNSKEQSYYSPFFLPNKSGVHKISYYLTDLVKNKTDKFSKSFYLDRAAPETNVNLDGSIFKEFNTYIISKDTKISLVSVDLESGVKEIYYSINNSGFTRYADSFSIEKDGLYELQYYAVDRVNNREDKSVMEMKVDNSPAVQEFAVPTRSEKRWFFGGEDSVLVGSANEPFYLIISDSPGKSDNSFLIDLSSANDTLPLMFKEYGKTELTLNLGGEPASFLVNVDGVPPKTSSEFNSSGNFNAGDKTYYGRELNISLSGEDVQSGYPSGLMDIRFSIDGSEFVPYESQIERFYREKTYNLSFYGIDSVGNAEDVNKSEFIVDLTPPSSKQIIEGSFYGNTLSENTALSIKASDNLCGVKNIYYSFDNNQFTPASGNSVKTGFSKLPNGRHTLNFYAEDNVGNKEEMNKFEFFVHKTPPKVNLKIIGNKHERANKIYLSPESRIQLSSPDEQLEIKSINYQINNGSINKFNGSFSLGNKTGNYRLNYYSIDVVDNKTPEQSKNIFLDDAVPKTSHSFNGPTFKDDSKLYLGSKTQIILSASDNESGVAFTQYTVNGGSVNRYTKGTTFNNKGNYKLSYRSVDNVNNVESFNSINFRVDNEGPNIKVTFSVDPQSGSNDLIAILPEDALIYLAANDTESGTNKITYKMGYGEEQLYRDPISGFESGKTYDIQITAVDQLLNKSEKNISIKIQ